VCTERRDHTICATEFTSRKQPDRAHITWSAVFLGTLSDTDMRRGVGDFERSREQDHDDFRQKFSYNRPCVCMLEDNKAGSVKGLNPNGEVANARKGQAYNAVRVGFGRGEDEHPWPFIHISEEAQ
jgi:hypothetical protein